jgi:hypothetical protein
MGMDEMLGKLGELGWSAHIELTGDGLLVGAAQRKDPRREGDRRDMGSAG